jgi:hypothetical protein
MTTRQWTGLVGLLSLVTLGSIGCENKEGNADSISGSGVEVNCREGKRLKAVPNQGGVGDTRTNVECAPVP